MKLSLLKIIFVSIVIGIAIALLLSIPVRWLWSSPGGSAYGIGFPLAYRVQYCGGYGPCYWANFTTWTYLAADLLLWIVVVAVALSAIGYYKTRKRKH